MKLALLLFSSLISLAQTPPTEITKEILFAGTGPTAQDSNKMVISYKLWNDKTNKLIDQRSSLEFTLDKDKLISGLYTSLLDTQAGQRIRIVVPPDHGYGEKGEGDIPPNTFLRFEVEVIKLEK